MSVPTIKYRNNNLVAHAVDRYVNGLCPPPRHLTLRPYNYTAPKFTEWWLIPSTDWPAFRYSKLCFGKSNSELMFTGFWVEKGMGNQLADMVKSNEIMERNWYWHELLEQGKAGALDKPLRAVQQRSGLPVSVCLSLYEFNHVRDPETGEDHPDDQLELVVGDIDLTFETVTEAANVLAPLNGAVTLTDLIARIADLGDLSWYWINFWVVIRVKYSQDGTGDWDAADIWHNALEPWLPWVM